MANKNLKVSYLYERKKLSFYLAQRLDNYFDLYDYIRVYLVNERKFPNAEYRLYWIDCDGDEIEIGSQSDFRVFVDISGEKAHLFVSPRSEETDGSATEEATTSNAQQKNTGFVHKLVECDGCKLPEIKGFRYKCLQCPNFDLCQNCESQLVHKEHLMLRMPDDTYRHEILAFTGSFEYFPRSRGKHSHKRSAAGCPFLMGPHGFTTATTSAAQANENSSASGSSGVSTAAGSPEQSPNSSEDAKQRDHHSRKRNKQHQRARGPANGLSKLFGMLNDLAGNVEPFLPQVEVETAASEAAIQAATAAVQAAQAAVQQVAGSASSSIFMNLNNASNVAPETPIIPTNNNNSNNQNNDRKNSNASNASANNNNNNGGTTTNNNNNNNNNNNGGTTTNNNNNNGGTNNNNNAGSNTPDIGQYIDPQYMKQGIQILSNFSDLFGKMLDTLETPDTSDAASNTSSMTSATNTAQTEAAKKQQEQPQQQTEQQSEQQKQQEQQPMSPEGGSLIEVMDLTERRSPSIDGDWQMIEGQQQQQQQQLRQQVSVNSTPDLISDNSNGVVNYQQLSNDLHAHLQLEESKASAAKQNVENTATTAAAVSAPAPTPTPTPNPAPTSPTAAASGVNANSDRRFVPVYHPDERINQSVIAMMAMGFSNENSWLTQLLDSVDGNISSALDLMTAAQRGQK